MYFCIQVGNPCFSNEKYEEKVDNSHELSSSGSGSM